jgi:hypothetical protein
LDKKALVYRSKPNSSATAGPDAGGGFVVDEGAGAGSGAGLGTTGARAGSEAGA